jgi:hypothetical protein
MHRGQARRVLAGVVVVSAALGFGSAKVVASLVDARPELEMTALGPMSIHLPEDVGPWEKVPTSVFGALSGSAALGGAVIDGAWGMRAPGAVVITVFTAAGGTHAGVESVRASVPDDEDADWAGDAEHIAGGTVSDGVRELMLVVEASDGDLVIMSLSAPVSAFESGTLEDAFRTSQVEG